MDTPIVGTIAFNPTDDRLLIYDIDTRTLPQNTLAAVDSVVDPLVKSPGNGLPTPYNGQRYLIVESIDSTQAYDENAGWGHLRASANDIIEYHNGAWGISFDSRNLTHTEYVTNVTTGVQYRYANGQWMKSWEGWYSEGDFSVVI